MLARVGENSIVVGAIVAAGVLTFASIVCIAAAMVYARRDARMRRAQPAPATHVPMRQQAPVVIAPADLHPLHQLNLQLRRTADPLVRMELAMQLAQIGGGQAALMLIAAVRDGVITPTAGAQAAARTGFDGGVVAGLALHDPDPSVRSFAHTLLEAAVPR